MALSYLPPAMVAYILALAGILGAVAASFIGCAVSRTLEGKNFVTGRSCCDSCGHTLSAADLVPIFSWLTLKGKCRYCKASIPIRCPLTEALLAAMYAALTWRLGMTWWTLGAMTLTAILLAVSLIDWDTGEIPNGLQLGGIASFLVFGFLDGGLDRLLEGLLGGLAASVPLFILVLVMDKVLGKESMGGGDIKLFFTVGLYFSWKEVIFLLITACIIGIIQGVCSNKRIEDSENPGAFPFGPAIAAAAAVSLLIAEPVVRWYFSLF